MPRIEHGKILVPAPDLQSGIKRVARNLYEQSKDTDPLNVGMLNGAVFFTTAVVMEMVKIDPLLNPEIEFIRTSSYGKGTAATKPRITSGLSKTTEIAGRHANLYDDIYETGGSMRLSARYLKRLGASGLTLVLMSVREDSITEDVLDDFEGFKNVNVHIAATIPSSAFAIGMGLDGPKGGRVLPYIAEHDN